MLVKPLITEKTIAEAAQKRYTFKVALKATKTEIKRGVEKVFGVKVLKVQTAVMPGKKRKHGKKWLWRRRSNWKKAMVTIQPDKQIDLFEVGKGEK